MRVLLLSVVLTLIAASVCAVVEFDVDVFPEQQTIRLNETAEFSIKITHNSPNEEVFEVYSPDIVWNILKEENLVVKPGEVFHTKIFLTPLNVNPGFYGVPLHFRLTGTNFVVKKNVVLEIISQYPPDMEYLPAIRGSAFVDSPVDPRDGITIDVHLENQNKRNLSIVDIKIRSNIVNKDYKTSLGPLEKKALTFVADIDPLTSPQRDVLRIAVIVPEKNKAYQFDLLPVEYSIMKYGGVVGSKSVEKKFFSKVKNFTFVNDGNTFQEHEFKLPASFLAKFFIKAPGARSEPGYYVWSLPLQPGDRAVVSVTYNYRPLFWTCLVIIIIIVLYFVFRSPIVVKKSARVVATQEGGISELKVVLEILNRGVRPVRNVRVLDLVPRIANIIKEFEAGTLAPTKLIPHEKRGTLVKWEIAELEPKEQRILTYKIKSKLSILGGITLPVAVVKFFTYAGKRADTKSNQPRISFESE